MPVVESLLTVPQVAKLVGLAPRTIWKLISAARAPEVVRLGRSVRLRASDVDLWIRLGCPSREVFEAEKAGGKAVRP